MKKIKWLISIAFICLMVLFLYSFNILPHLSYPNNHFGIETQISSIDQDGDGIDDQSDILQSALQYIAKRPRYKSVYYVNGYPDDDYGVCTDVIGFALLNAGYDLKELVSEDITLHPEYYDIEYPDSNIDFRRVKNLLVYFQHHAISLTTDINEIEKWQGGDIVIFDEHIGIISNKRNRKGIPFLIHHAHPYQLFYEEDVLERMQIVGHYRISE